MSQFRSRDNSGMGTLAWGVGNGGELNRLEKARLVRNLAYVQVRDVVDTLRHRIGLLRPNAISLDEMAPPTTALTEDAMQLAEETHDKALLFHSWRTYYFGAMLAAHERIDYDRSLFFAAAILHDIGLTTSHSPHLCDCCFAMSGGVRVRDYLRAKGHSHDVREKVGDAIALHLNGWVSKRRHGAVAHLVSRGAGCDLFGAGRRRLEQTTLAKVLERYPRDGVIEALQFETADHHLDTRPAVMTALAGRKAPPDPFRRVLSPA
ncbi:HD domain-containing protein [Cupriavidus oxalaticus]|uniref:HD domain-containing protein n=1 Tax=Cupriavidus oxalaticus TaxID=96344 RepID=UPI0031809FC5